MAGSFFVGLCSASSHGSGCKQCSADAKGSQGTLLGYDPDGTACRAARCIGCDVLGVERGGPRCE